jgi:hypothetical protein
MCFGSVFIFVKEKDEEDNSWVEHNRSNGEEALLGINLKM